MDYPSQYHSARRRVLLALAVTRDPVTLRSLRKGTLAKTSWNSKEDTAGLVDSLVADGLVAEAVGFEGVDRKPTRAIRITIPGVNVVRGLLRPA